LSPVDGKSNRMQRSLHATAMRRPARRAVPHGNVPKAEALPDDPGLNGSVVEGVISAIKWGLRTGRFAPGQRLIETDVCLQTGAGRSSVREATRRLAAEGLVELEHHKGARIRYLDLKEVLEIYQVREVLEGLAARLAARNASKTGNRERLLKLEREFDAEFEGSPSKYMAYNVAFHRTVLEIADNLRLVRLIEQLELPAFLSLLHVIVDPPAAELSRAEHRPIVKAIIAGKEKAAGEAMQKHIARTARYIRDHADDTNFGDRRRQAAQKMRSGSSRTKTR
jgi:DNA-binding GntR family transcriptional regulator